MKRGREKSGLFFVGGESRKFLEVLPAPPLYLVMGERGVAHYIEGRRGCEGVTAASGGVNEVMSRECRVERRALHNLKVLHRVKG